MKPFTSEENWKQYGALIFHNPKAGRRDVMQKLLTMIFLGFALGVATASAIFMEIK